MYVTVCVCSLGKSIKCYATSGPNFGLRFCFLCHARRLFQHLLFLHDSMTMPSYAIWPLNITSTTCPSGS